MNSPASTSNAKSWCTSIGSPADIPGPLSATFSSIEERWKALKAAGSIGYIVIPNPASQEIPWSRITLNRTQPTMDLAAPEFNETSGLQLAVIFNSDKAEKLFVGSGHTFAEVAALAKDRKPLPGFPLSVALKAHRTIVKSELESSNVIAKLPGRDPVLKDEYVVLSAHIDHIGIGAPLTATTSTTAPWTTALDPRCFWMKLMNSSLIPREAAPLNFVRVCYQLRERLTWLKILCRSSHCRSQSDDCQHQHRHVPSNNPFETDGCSGSHRI